MSVTLQQARIQPLFDLLRLEYISRSYNPLALWKINEPSGTSGAGSVIDYSGNGYHGTPTAVTFAGDTFPVTSENAATFDGSTSYINVHSAGLATAFDSGNYGNECTIMAWGKVAGAVWTDGASRYFYRFMVDASNRLYTIKSSTNNRIEYHHDGGATVKFQNVDLSPVPSGFFSTALRVTGGELDAFYNGVKQGTTVTGLGTFAGALNGNNTVLGAANVTPALQFSGALAYIGIFPPLTDGQITAVSSFLA